MLFNIIKQLISQERTDGLEEKIDGFYAASKLTKKENDELLSMLRKH